jgi:hypothetical protein
MKMNSVQSGVLHCANTQRETNGTDKFGIQFITFLSHMTSENASRALKKINFLMAIQFIVIGTCEEPLTNARFSCAVNHR